MTSMEHRTDLVEAYALGALDPADQVDMEAHMAVCQQCRTLAQTSTDAANMLSLAARPMEPPLRCKRTVLDRIERDQFLRSPTPRRAARRVPVSTWATVAAMVALLATGGWGFTLQTRLGQAQSQINQMSALVSQQQQQLSEMNTRMTQLASFSNVLADGEEVCEMQRERAKAKCFARPGENQGVMVVWGLGPLPTGKAYQLWLANEEEQAPLTVFTASDGMTPVSFAPPDSFDRYDAIMVTVEDANGADQPSKEIVLDGSF